MTAGWSRVLLGALMAVLVALAAHAPAAQGQSSGTRVMPLGDSITDGYNIPGGYRIVLEDQLAAGGDRVDFVGSSANGPPSLADREHEGHSGWRIDQIAGSVDGWLRRHDPQVVMLLIGTNDIIQNYAVSGAPQRLSALVDRITTTAPSAWVLVSSLPPLADPALEQRVRAYNAALPGIVAAKQAQGRRVRFVDMHPALSTSDLADGVHPNATGYARMASVWSSALRGVLSNAPPALAPNTPPTVALNAPAGNASFLAPATISLSATAADADGGVNRVEFLAGSTLLGTDATAPYEWRWSGVLAGDHTVTARAVDDRGAVTASSPVSVRVRDPASAPPGVIPRVPPTPVVPGMPPPSSPVGLPARMSWSAKPVSERLRRVLGRGLGVDVRLDRAATVSARLVIDPALARKLRLTRRRVEVTIGSRRAKVAGGTQRIRLPVRSAARRALARQRKVSVSLRVVAVDAATGTRYRRSTRVTLNR